MPMTRTDDPKYIKKMAKVQAKAAKKQRPAESAAGIEQNNATERSPAERSAEAAERQVTLQRWRVGFTLVSTLIALVTLALLFLKAVN